MKTECDYLNGWIKKRSHTQKSHSKVVNPRYIAGERKKKEKKKSDLDVGFIFSHTSTHPDEIWYIEAVQVEHVHMTLEWVLFNCFTDCIKNFGVVMSFDSIVLIWFKLNIMIHTTGCYILILVPLTSTISQSHRGGGKQKLQIQWSHKVFYGLEWNLACCWDLVDWWTSFSFYLLKMNF